MTSSRAGVGVRERLVAEIPVVEQRLQLANVSTAVLEGGSGPPVVLLHGLESSPSRGCE